MQLLMGLGHAYFLKFQYGKACGILSTGCGFLKMYSNF